jgi:predicted hydrocarbon binding protein
MFDIRKIQEQVIFEAVRNHSDAETAGEVVFGKDETAKGENNAVWVKSTIRRLENKFDVNAVKEIRMNCQCGYGMDEKLALLNELLDASHDMESFANQEKARAAGLYCDKGELYLQFFFCPCPMLATVEKLSSYTWCQCTTGYSKVLFEKAFGCAVDVELLKSIKVGDDICLMKIIPKGQIRE